MAVFNKSLAHSFCEDFKNGSSAILKVIRDMDDFVGEEFFHNSNVIQGNVANEILKAWKDNCAIFLNYDNEYTSYINKMKDIIANSDSAVEDVSLIYANQPHSAVEAMGMRNTPPAYVNVSETNTVLPGATAPMGVGSTMNPTVEKDEFKADEVIFSDKDDEKAE